MLGQPRELARSRRCRPSANRAFAVGAGSASQHLLPCAQTQLMNGVHMAYALSSITRDEGLDYGGAAYPDWRPYLRMRE